MITSNDLEKLLLDKLKASNYVEHILTSSVLADISVKVLKELVSTRCNSDASEQGLSFTDSSGDKINCPNFSANTTDEKRWLSDKTPELGFGVEQSGNLRKLDEAEATYHCVVVVLVLKVQIFRDELMEVINKYHYETISGLRGSKGFKDLLTEWLDIQSTIISVCVSIRKYKISTYKKNIEKFLQDSMIKGTVDAL